ncbi:phage Gp37/Gp68 family protein [Agrobacterium vitis]|uniref:Phage Gp37/Gp68 family protein n=1 Tax=Agrobacterium vitis TaxID=373 RepID=A0AAE2RDX2_AGRVI|nr:phage Gp37/Gp68 family protein [Agrobacterium vitis]MBF2715689.1 phage Gp37/Gp68 family protein [Agrobacterium vitis]
MADNTKIEWTDATWNPITGCSIVSPGCTNCYAMKLAGTRLQHHPSRAGLTKDSKAGPVWTGEVRFNAQWLTEPLKWKRPRMIFVCAHGDLFAEGVPDEWIDQVFAVMALAPHHTFQVLTKRPERMRGYLSVDPEILRDRWYKSVPAGKWPVSVSEAHAAIHPHASDDMRALYNRTQPVFPLPNVWLGVSVEDQARADQRITILLETPAAIHWMSAEPLIGPVVVNPWLDWVVAGGESGRNARPMHPDWVISLRDQCAAAGVPFLFKQWGEWHTAAYRTTDEEPVFRQFTTFDQWVNKASTWINGGICLDRTGRQLKIGGDFMRARDEGTFPVTIMHRLGKKAAGRMLDGVEHNGFPVGRAA